jgi:hypothetical protein
VQARLAENAVERGSCIILGGRQPAGLTATMLIEHPQPAAELVAAAGRPRLRLSQDPITVTAPSGPFAVTQLDLRVLAISGDAHPQSSAEFRQCINARQRNSAASLALSPAGRLSTGAANPAVPQKARKTRCFLPRFAGSLRPPKALR